MHVEDADCDEPCRAHGKHVGRVEDRDTSRNLFPCVKDTEQPDRTRVERSFNDTQEEAGKQAKQLVSASF